MAFPFISFFRSNKLLKEIGWSFVNKALVFILYMITNIILARSMGPGDYGQLALFLSISTVITTLSYFGINKASRSLIAADNENPARSVMIKSSLILRLQFSLTFSLLAFLFKDQIALALGNAIYLNLFLLLPPLILASGLLEYLKEIFFGLHRLKYVFYVSLIEYLSRLIFLLLVISRITIQIVIYTQLAAYLLAITVGLYSLYKNFYLRSKFDKKLYKKTLLYSLPLFLTSIGAMLSTEIDTIMIGLLVDEVEVGIYSVPKQLINKLPHIAFAIAMGVMPLYAKYEKNREDMKRLFYKLLKINTLIFGSIFIFLLTLSWWLIPFLYGDSYSRSVIPLILLLPYMLSVSYSVYFTYFLDYRGKAKKRALNLTIAIISTIVLNFLLIPRYGARGAAISTSLSYLPYIILNWKEVKEELG